MIVPIHSTAETPKIAVSRLLPNAARAGTRNGMTATGMSRQNNTGNRTRPCMKSPPTRRE